MITPLYVALLGLFFIGLSVHVLRGRRQFGIAVGDADHHEMKRRMRAQGNFAEYTPLFLIMLGYVEHGGLSVYAVHLFGIVFIAGRMMHAYSLLKYEQYKEGKLSNKVD
jgi:uncharacterized membrane protein YecN with MAPEG domain